MAIQYDYPVLYGFFMRFLYTPRFMKEFKKVIGKNNSVFEVAAGYGRISKYIDPSNTYYGIDLNKKFVDYGKRQGLMLAVMDALDLKAYKKSDIFIVVDFVHHISKQKSKELFDLIFTHARKKVVVVEPSFLDFTNRFGILGKLAGWFSARIDNDGFNKIDRFFSNSEYEELFKNRFGSIHGENFSLNYRSLDGHHLAIFSRIK